MMPGTEESFVDQMRRVAEEEGGDIAPFLMQIAERMDSIATRLEAAEDVVVNAQHLNTVLSYGSSDIVTARLALARSINAYLTACEGKHE